VKDLIANLGESTEIPGVGDQFLLPALTASTVVSTPGYVLLIGQAREELPGGVFGPLTDFALASQEVPEPSILTLFMLQLIFLGGLAIACRRKRAGPRSAAYS
jgi:hypothetical protein